MFTIEASGGVPKLFVGGLPPSLIESDFAKVIRGIGEAKVNLIKKTNSNLNEGFAFVFPSTKEVAELLLASEIYVQGRRLQFQLSSGKRSPENMAGKRLFLRNIPYSIPNDELADFFRQFCNIRAAYSIQDTYGRSRGFGFIDLYDSEAAEKLLSIGAFKIHGFLATVEVFNPQFKGSFPVKRTSVSFPKRGSQQMVKEPSYGTPKTGFASRSKSPKRPRTTGVSKEKQMKAILKEVSDKGRVSKGFLEESTSKFIHSTENMRFNLLCRYIRADSGHCVATPPQLELLPESDHTARPAMPFLPRSPD